MIDYTTFLWAGTAFTLFGALFGCAIGRAIEAVEWRDKATTRMPRFSAGRYYYVRFNP